MNKLYSSKVKPLYLTQNKSDRIIRANLLQDHFKENMNIV